MIITVTINIPQITNPFRNLQGEFLRSPAQGCFKILTYFLPRFAFHEYPHNESTNLTKHTNNNRICVSNTDMDR